GVLADIAIPITLGATITGKIAAGATVFYQISPVSEGKLVASVHTSGGTARLSLLNSEDQALMQSDGESLANADCQVSLHVPPGTEYLEVENLGDASDYSLTTSLKPLSSPFQAIPGSPLDDPSAVVTADFNRDGYTDCAIVNVRSNSISVLL